MEIKNGLLGTPSDQISPNDYLAGAITNIPTLTKQDDVWYLYNQGSSSDCTLYASMVALGATMNYKMTDSDIQEIIKLAIKQGKDPNDGRYLYKAIDCVRNRWNNKYPDKKVISVQVNMLDNAKDYFDKGYCIATTYQGNSKYNKDKNDNGIIQQTNYGATTYGHAVNRKSNPEQAYVLDNYVGNKWNVYGLLQPKELIYSGVFSKNGYVFLSGQDKETIKARSHSIK